ncbi:TIGR04141 family sporadically distributed protein, partial [Enterococcus hirae]
MKLILSKCRTNNFSEVSRILNENGYIQIGESRTEPKNNLELFFFFESHEKKQIEWLSELLRFFNVGKADYKEHNIIDDTLYQYNAVIILKTPNNLYAHSLSQGFRVLEKFIDEEFGLKFAEKTIKNEHITLKNVSYIQKNKMKGITNYKKDQGEFPKASESYAYISGKPDFSFYGNSIDCGTGVSFPKNFDINSKEGFDQLSELLKNVDKALTLKENKSILPRKKRIAKSSQLSGSLDEEVIERIVNDVNEIGIALDVSKIHLV